MSGFGGGQFDDADTGGAIERRIQEELRVRQASAAASRAGALGFGSRPRTTADQAFMSSLLAAESAATAGASPYYAQRAAQAHSSPFGRGPYSALGQQQAAASAYGVSHSPNEAVASLYARQRAQQYGYGGAAATPAEQRFHGYGVPAASHEALYSQHFGRSAQEISLIDRAAAYNAQQRQAEQQNAALLQQAAVSKSPTASISASTLSYMQKGTPKLSSPTAKSTPRQSSAQASQTLQSQQVETPTPKSPGRPTPPSRPRPRPVQPRAPTVKSMDSDGGTPKPSIGLNKDPSKRMSPSEGGVTADSQQWFSGCVPLGLEDDKYWLSELQVYLRANFAEAFGATEEDIAAPMHGRNKPIALGQVGIRCSHCKHENPAERGQQATSYPSLISGIYNSVQQMLRLHLDCCQAMPPEVRQKIEQLKLSSSSRGGRKQYWIDSAKRLGLVDTPHGIHFGRDPLGPLPPLTGPSVNSKEGRKKKEAQKKDDPEEELKDMLPPIPQVEERPLVFPDDKPLISDYLYLTLEQMSPCVLMEADRVGCYKTRKVGFPGLACRHCVGQAGCGRYFPASEASLSQTTTSQTIMNHVRNCRRCPVEIRENLEIMKRARMGPDGKRADKPKHGGRKVFFHRLWCRIQGIPMEDGKGETKEKRKRGKKVGSGKKAKKRASASPDSDSEPESESDMPAAPQETSSPPKQTDSSEEETETESSSDEESDKEKTEEPAKEEPEKVEKAKQTGKPAVSEKKRQSPWYEGCVRLTKTDDPHWLSEMQCFARSDLVEVFSFKKKDSLEGYSGRKEPAAGQVGIRCVFCKTMKPSERPAGCLTFPDSLSSIHTKVGDMLRLHFHSCPAMSEDAKNTFKTLRGFGAKVADDSQQYWVDSARDIGLVGVPPGGPGVGWGITFRRDPLQPSPSDELDRESVGAAEVSFGKASLIRADDRGLCTDQVMLLMRQVKACTFQKRDRRGGPGARGRDRVNGFPGLCCKHCATKNNIGRYFPVSAKNLTDNTANSLQSHISTCSRCPEPIKASLAYLSHRSILQKAELSGSWKKTFFKKVWDRLHVERAWSAAGDSEEEEGVASVSSDEPHDEPESKESGSGGSGAGEGASAGTGAAAGAGSTSDTDEEELDDHMNALIKAAAIWLTEQDQVTDNVSRTRTARGRGLPGSKRSGFSPRGKGRGSLTAKRRRVHF